LTGQSRARGGDRWFGRALQLGIEKGTIKARIVRHNRRIADEANNSSATAPNNGLSAKNSADKPCTANASAG
jgi:hypothetical protein